MDLRDLPEQLSGFQRINMRRTRIETELRMDLGALEPRPEVIGEAEKKNCEQMFGVVPLPVGYAGPLTVMFSSRQRTSLHLPLATTEGALVASVNRGCKAASINGVSIIRTVNHGMSRSIAFTLKAQSSSLRQGFGRQAKLKAPGVDVIINAIRSREAGWKRAGEATSNHLKIIGYDLDIAKKYVFLTIACDTDEAMGMNMVTIAAQAIADWIVANVEGAECVTIAGNVDSDKKPSRRTYERGRGFEVIGETELRKQTITDILKTTPEAMLRVAEAKLLVGSALAGAIGRNLHAANIIAALYLATGQDAAHVAEGSMADTSVQERGDGLVVQVRLPAILAGVRGGGTELPAQAQCRALLLSGGAGLPPKQQLAESIAAAVLAGEISLLAAQANHDLAKAHEKLAR